jgi:hypothetical protein
VTQESYFVDKYVVSIHNTERNSVLRRWKRILQHRVLTNFHKRLVTISLPLTVQVSGIHASLRSRITFQTWNLCFLNTRRAILCAMFFRWYATVHKEHKLFEHVHTAMHSADAHANVETFLKIYFSLMLLTHKTHHRKTTLGTSNKCEE